MISTFIITAYCLSGIMANGEKVHQGAVACPRFIPLGTKICINNKSYTCHDRLSKKYDNRFDIWMPSCQDTIKFGKQKLRVYYEDN